MNGTNETVHYFDKTQMAYTACKQLTISTQHTADTKVNCPKCLLAMMPEQVNAILGGCGPEEAFEFLGVLGHVRAADIDSGAL